MTNTDCSEISDFEINKRVAEYLGYIDIAPHYQSTSAIEYTGRFDSRMGKIKYEFDPCNNPTDAWPIIETKKISLVYVNNQWSARQYYKACIEVNDSSALKAAMIVFLMMQDEGEKGEQS